MELLSRARRPVRASLTRTLNEIEVELGKDAPDKKELLFRQRKVLQVREQLADLDQKFLGAMLEDETFTDEAYEAESLIIEGYRDRVTNAEMALEVVLSSNPPNSPEPSLYSSASAGGTKRNFKLPKIELKKFNGELTEWLGWWSQFEKIHLDEELHPSDKFSYLVQSMIPETRAQKLVESYPQSADNYPKVIKALQDRYGDKVLLSEVYVRQLLKMVVANVDKEKHRISLANMFDELESHLRSLESLGVSAEQSAIFLYPLVESSLPEDIIKAWQRSPLSGYDGEEELKCDERLKSLMKFLRAEVKGAERLSYVKSGLDTTQKKSTTVKNQQKKFNSEDCATAAGLHVGQGECIFCDKSHESDRCIKAQSMSLTEKRSKIQTKNACFLCLKPGHSAKKCKAAVKCVVCKKKHWGLMCPDISMNRSESSQNQKKHEIPTPLANLSCTSEVLLQTLMVNLLGNDNGEKKMVRVLLDPGSQRSYILKRTAETLGCRNEGELELKHLLFGGSSEAKYHKKYQIRVGSTHGNFRTVFHLLDHPKICGLIPRVRKGPWLKELKERGIWVNDVGEGNPEIEMLVGSDYYIPLLTGKSYSLSNGLYALETKFGWTIAGSEHSQMQNNTSVAMSVTSQLLTKASVQDLWKLETIGI